MNKEMTWGIYLEAKVSSMKCGRMLCPQAHKLNCSGDVRGRCIIDRP